MNKSTQKVLSHFKKHDKVLFQASKKLKRISGPNKAESKDYFMTLCRMVIGQQLAGAAAKTIYSRFEFLFSGKVITPQKVLNASLSQIRQAGLSNAKASYVKNIAKAVITKDLDIKSLQKLNDEKVLEELTKIKGVGPWTAEMFLMFVLGREDVFSQGDLGLHNSIAKIYKFKKDPTKNQIEKISNKWKPYRTYACTILWDILDNGIDV